MSDLSPQTGLKRTLDQVAVTPNGGAERALGMQRLAEQAQVGAQFGIGIAQQVRQHAQRMDGGDGTGREDRHLRLPA